MLLELTTTQRPATDLGFLLHKNPARVHSSASFSPIDSLRKSSAWTCPGARLRSPRSV
jgi:hypothetical protein